MNALYHSKTQEHKTNASSSEHGGEYEFYWDKDHESIIMYSKRCKQRLGCRAAELDRWKSEMMHMIRPMNSKRLISMVLLVGILWCCSAGSSVRGSETNSSKSRRAKPNRTFPEFSWDRIPLYMHIRKARSFTPREIAFIARFPLITFEKANGHTDHGSVEKGTLIAARAVKKINPKARVLYYRNVIVHYGRYDANKALDRIPNAFLADKTGNSKLVRGRVRAYDLANPAVRKWWANSCRSMTADPAIDGVFLDGNIKALEPGYLARKIGASKKKLTADGYRLMIEQTRKAIGPDKLMIANILRARFRNAGLEHLDSFDGSYIEGFFHNVGKASYEEYVAKGIDAMRKAAGKGKIIAFTTGLASPKNTSHMGIDEGRATVKSDKQARAALAYRLAIFLICAEKYSYFRVHEGYSANDNDRWMRWFPEYDKPLGPPDGPAKKDGFVYCRTFKHASVKLDIKNRAAEIRWRTPASGGEQNAPAGAK